MEVLTEDKNFNATNAQSTKQQKTNRQKKNNRKLMQNINGVRQSY